ncbi:protocatechuate 3,4-dioxygenase subunit beta [Ahrensia sp. 13_GOM-1096m]|uniref:protocatechuate 3,4-dioxygenase subunit beta n=1 Tax=Ahrensia sp. 13_GOM-1096m TaxID=1380380 RepID=UPI00047A691E|nr:protocatechuate 3,4-dioxygenase subunit beta [Ahrensia sp. 13_GOM-1096m]
MSSSIKGVSPRQYDAQPAMDYPDYRSTILRHPKHKLVAVPQTLSDVTGPAFGDMALGQYDSDLIVNYAEAGQSAIGERIVVHGQVLDEAARPVPHALIEVWQANAGGRYRHKNDAYLAPLDPNFGGCGRCVTDAEGRYQFRTIKPGPYPWPNGGNDWRPAHIHFSIFGSGFAQRLITQMYFEGDPHIAICPIVQSINDARAVDQLTARLDMSNSIPMDLRAYRFDLVLRGPRSTLFENKLEGN